MKKVLSTVILVAAVAVISLTSFAAEEDLAIAAKKAERKAFKESISQQISGVKEARTALKGQHDEIKELASSIKAALNADKESETPKISEETRAQIKLIFGEIKEIRSDLKNLKAELGEVKNARKESITALDEEGAASACEAMVSLFKEKQQTRVQIIEKLNEINALIS